MKNKVAKVVMVLAVSSAAQASALCTIVRIGPGPYDTRMVCEESEPYIQQRPAQSVTCRTEPIIFGQPQYGFRTVCN